MTAGQLKRKLAKIDDDIVVTTQVEGDVELYPLTGRTRLAADTDEKPIFVLEYAANDGMDEGEHWDED